MTTTIDIREPVANAIKFSDDPNNATDLYGIYPEGESFFMTTSSASTSIGIKISDVPNLIKALELVQASCPIKEEDQ